MDGHTIYQGAASEASHYFDKLGFHTPQFMNPIDYFLREFYVPFRKTEEDVLKLDKLVRGYITLQLESVKTQNAAIMYEEINDEMFKETFKRAGILCSILPFICQSR